MLGGNVRVNLNKSRQMFLDTSPLGSRAAADPVKSRKQITAQAKAQVMKSDIQERLNSQLGGFVWHVEKWPNWLQISVDVIGNSSDQPRLNDQVADAWQEQHKARLQEMFAEVLGDQFGEIAILGRAMGPGPNLGSCCRTGCAGCMNGPHEKMLPTLKPDNQPVDRVG